MNTIKTHYVLPAIILAMLLSAFALFTLINSSNTALGSVGFGDDYTSTTTTSAFASGTAPFVISNHTGSLASIIIASSSAQLGAGLSLIRVYDHTSATGTMPYGASAGTNVATSTLLFSMPANSAAGTYTFDLQVRRGIVLDVPAGFVGNWVITYR